jgi:beta-aspartyl-dipeptidase (metallo-type)
MIFTLIQNGELYTPEPRGIASVLLANGNIVKIGSIEPGSLQAIGFEYEVIDATGCVVTPGFIDPHQHIIGAGGEEGFTSRMPEILLSQIVSAGITTVLGILGTDTTTRHLSCLHAKASQLSNEGITTYIYTGGFELPPSTLTGSVLDDIVIIDKIIGTGEVAISDYRWVNPPLHELATVVTATMLGGMMGGKAGVTHFHIGSGKGRLSPLHELLDNYEMPASCIYATHITRNMDLLDDAITLARRGAYVDMDTIEENLGECLRYYQEHDGPLDQLTISSDAYTPEGSPRKLYEQFVACVQDHHFGLAELLPLFTTNPAKVLKLAHKGRLQEGKDGDVLVLHKDTLEIRHLFAGGRQFIKAGQLNHKSKQEAQVEASKV